MSLRRARARMRLAFETALRDSEAVERATIPVERIDGPLLFLSGADDAADAVRRAVRDCCPTPPAGRPALRPRDLPSRRSPHYPTALRPLYCPRPLSTSISSTAAPRLPMQPPGGRLAAGPHLPGRQRRQRIDGPVRYSWCFRRRPGVGTNRLVDDAVQGTQGGRPRARVHRDLHGLGSSGDRACSRVPHPRARACGRRWPAALREALDRLDRDQRAQAPEVLWVARIERQLVGVGDGGDEQVGDARAMRPSSHGKGGHGLTEASRGGKIEVERLKERLDLLQTRLTSRPLQWIARPGVGQQRARPG